MFPRWAASVWRLFIIFLLNLWEQMSESDGTNCVDPSESHEQGQVEKLVKLSKDLLL